MASRSSCREIVAVPRFMTPIRPNVGNVRGFKRRSPTRERQSIRGKNGVTGAGDVNSLVAAMNGDLHEAIVWFKQGRHDAAVTRSDCNFISEGSFGPRERVRRYLDRWRCDAPLQARLIWRSGSNARLRIGCNCSARRV